MKKTVIIGATPNPSRYAFFAAQRLTEHGHEIIPLGIKKGEVGNGVKIINEKPHIDNVDTVTMYVGPGHQENWMDYIISLQPKRIIFNPGTENEVFYEKLRQENIFFEEACTLVMLSAKTY
ncbi:CoA-binding protein [Flammeovirga agarivorans]|uniref:CoA-binding protein n=1 Tax=Flammeovirga agarivorans TaxID=2726742 RepID=A0A7X8SGF9_9BACT|nr:CoA-binding protein [Flammeovirga agarivorans]NLR89729.1 CoA-binding protein [Flammeovirga agarivorans]